jgi:hypothetical protein
LSGVAKVLSTATIAPWLPRRGADGVQVTDGEQRVRRRLQPDQIGLAAQFEPAWRVGHCDAVCRPSAALLTGVREAGDTRVLGIVIPSPERVRDHQHLTVHCSTQPKTAGFKRGVAKATGSRKTVMAASNVTPCFSALAAAFRGSQSNTYSVYT